MGRYANTYIDVIIISPQVAVFCNGSVVGSIVLCVCVCVCVCVNVYVCVMI